ncbi:MAG: SPOR domain-containing protein [Rhodoferax sp.]
MALFKFRKGADDPASAPAVQPPSVEVIRQRAKYRLVGATVLVLAGVICLPLLLDSQPRPVAVNTPIEIPDKNKIAPLAMPGPPAVASASAAAPLPRVASAVVGKLAAPASDIITESAAPVSKPVSHPQSALAAAKAAESARAKALLEGRNGNTASALDAKRADAQAAQTKAAASTSTEPVAVEGRFIVQVGAFAEATRAHEVRLKVERAGLKTYTHIAETKDGRRIRVRVGPFSNRTEAEKAAERIKKLSLPATLLTL